MRIQDWWTTHHSFGVKSAVITPPLTSHLSIPLAGASRHRVGTPRDTNSEARRLRRKLAATALLALVVVLVAWGIAIQTKAAVARWIRPNFVTISAPPSFLTDQLHGRPFTWGAVGIDGRGNVVVGIQNTPTTGPNQAELARFDPRSKRWLRGVISGSWEGDYTVSSALQTVTVGETEWILVGGTSAPDAAVLRARFSSGWSAVKAVVRAGNGQLWGWANMLEAGGQGRVWIGGSGGVVPGTTSGCDSLTSAGIVCGYSEIGLYNGQSGPIAPIRVSGSGTATGMAVGPRGSLWMVVPKFKLCPSGSCVESALIRYDPTTHRSR